eukprot:SAG11_NODE_1008_length_6205_cov_3.939240_8_plen_192_part_00
MAPSSSTPASPPSHAPPRATRGLRAPRPGTRAHLVGHPASQSACRTRAITDEEAEAERTGAKGDGEHPGDAEHRAYHIPHTYGRCRSWIVQRRRGTARPPPETPQKRQNAESNEDETLRCTAITMRTKRYEQRAERSAEHNRNDQQRADRNRRQRSAACCETTVVLFTERSGTAAKERVLLKDTSAHAPNN